MELAIMIVKYAEEIERENRCYLEIIINKMINYKIYIIPNNDKLIIQYNKLTLLIERTFVILKEVIRYFYSMIENDYQKYIRKIKQQQEYINKKISYEFKLNIGKMCAFEHFEFFDEHNYDYTVRFNSFCIDDIVKPLIYMINPITI
jgi:hypothetical protein